MGLAYGNDHSYLSNVEVTNAFPGVSRVGCLINQLNNFTIRKVKLLSQSAYGGGECVRVAV